VVSRGQPLPHGFALREQVTTEVVECGAAAEERVRFLEDRHDPDPAAARCNGRRRHMAHTLCIAASIANGPPARRMPLDTPIESAACDRARRPAEVVNVKGAAGAAGGFE
jgi:hypothetical protein